ncbi:MAG TPA: GNAT family N-acetyltransferase [Micromonosporaceae bacterium]|nr:GNAT family N-acetyltransferase [Micromonosporaceae bacterium]
MPHLLTTARMDLRPFTSDDLDHLVELDSDPEVMRFLGNGRPTPRATVEREMLPRATRWYDRLGGPAFWAAIDRGTGDFLGWFELRPLEPERPDDAELGYRLRRIAWGKGYATEGARALVDWGLRRCGLHRIRATTMAVNVASRRVMEKAGLTYVRTFHESWPEPIPGTEHGEVEYSVTRKTWAHRSTTDW